jgi:hypothetical protein
MPDLGEIFAPTPFEKGDVAVVTNRRGRVVGKITGFDGTPFRGVYPILEVTTPHGTMIRVGRCYVQRPNAFDLDNLAQYEAVAEASEKCEHLYGDRLR